MARHVWSVLCDRAIVDRETGQVSMLNVVEKFIIHDESLERFEERVGDATGVAHRLHLVSWWVRSNYERPEVANVRLRWRFSSGKGIEHPPLEVSLEQTNSARTLLRMQGVPWRGVGRYWLDVQLAAPRKRGGWQTVAEIPLEVVFQEDGPGQP